MGRLTRVFLPPSFKRSSVEQLGAFEAVSGTIRGHVNIYYPPAVPSMDKKGTNY